jgi:alpha-tubulin suppressor-like RCC1 family protein
MRKTLVPVVFILALTACDETTNVEPDVQIALVSGADQLGGFGGTLPQPIVVRVMSPAGLPLAGETVSWHIVAGGGHTDSLVTRTNTAGDATVHWTLGVDTGLNVLSARARNATIAIRSRGEFQFASVAVGFRHSCAVSSLGDAFCWGNNASGQLGDGTETDRTVPTRVLTTKRFRSVTAGWTHTCGVSVAGELFCWGDNVAGQLGIGSTVPRAHAPLRVAGDSVSFTSVSTGFVHTCGISAVGLAYCWGANGAGQLGIGIAQIARVPTAVATATRFTSISAGEFHTCAIAVDASASCWGLNSVGELGAGIPFGEMRNTPVRVTDINNVTAITAGVRHTCATAGQLYCWGRNAFGETGAPPQVHLATPGVVSTSQSFNMLGAGNVISCGAHASGAYCWGNDGVGSSTIPELRFTGAVRSLGVGYEQVCVVAGGDVYCWGAGSRTPVKISRPY